MSRYRLSLAALAAAPVALAIGLALAIPGARAAVQNPTAFYERPPELTGDSWLNTAGKPLTLKERTGRVTVLHFWTFG